MNTPSPHISLVRTVAIVLIVNSHLDEYYPIRYLGTGGAIGNALFFFLAGYGLMLSYQERPRSFPTWYLRRVRRIYPSLFIAVSVFYLLLPGSWRHWSWHDYLAQFLWPTPYWFISALMIFYAVFFAFMRNGRPRALITIIAALMIPYALWYVTALDLSRYVVEGPGYFKWIFYLQIMLFGGFLALCEPSLPKAGFRHAVSLFSLLVIYALIVVLTNRGFGVWQFLVHVITYPVLYCVLILSRSVFLSTQLLRLPFVAGVVSVIAGLTLEIYLTHGYVYSRPYIQSLAFPLNIIAVWTGVIGLSFILSRTSTAALGVVERQVACRGSRHSKTTASR